ncbi:hypothetical protein GF337_07510 [candidate division KSB1 bacterium]|nr:hypothetical protein [candidate division KSB1 bacterium]
MVDTSYDNSEPDIEKSSLNKYCLNEIDNNLKYIEFCIEECKSKDGVDKSLVKLLNSCQTIEDLAMIYGYQGVENLAANINSAVSSIVEGKRKITAAFLDKLAIALEGIRSMSGIDDEMLVSSIVNSTTDRILNRNTQIAPIEKKEKERLTRKSNKKKKKPLQVKQPQKKAEQQSRFEIKEANTIQSLIDLIEKNRKSESNSANDAQPEEKEKEKLNNGEIEKVFNTIFLEETHENLSFLQEALEAIGSDSAPGESIMRIKEACGSLKDSAASFNVTDVRETLDRLHRISSKHLNFTESPSAEAINLIRDTHEFLSGYIKNQGMNPDKINQKLDEFLAKKSSENAYSNHSNEQDVDEIRVVDELQTFPKPKKKKKVKVIFNEEEDNIRRITKFK